MQKLIRILGGIGFVIFSIIFVVFLSGWWDNDPETTGRFPWMVAVMMIVSASTDLFGSAGHGNHLNPRLFQGRRMPLGCKPGAQNHSAQFISYRQYLLFFLLRY